MPKRLELNDVIKIIESTGLKYVNGNYCNHDSKLIVKCRCGNNFETTLRIIKNHIKTSDNNCYCKKCIKEMARERYSYTMDYVRKNIEERGMKLISDEYINSKTKIKVVGKCGHEFETTFDSICNNNISGYCKKCVNAQERAYNWNGGYDLEQERFRKTYEFKEFRKGIMERDRYTCVCCGRHNGEMNAHHLDGYNWCIEKRVNVNNGVCLCKDCHELFHKIYGHGNNTKEQFYEFLISFLK